MNILIIVKTLLIIVQVVLIGRFHFELAKLNAFIEPVSSIRKITNPLVLPMKRWMPFPWAKRFAAIKVAYLITLVGLLVFTGKLGIVNIFVIPLVLLFSTWVAFLKYGMILFVIMSWVTMFAGGSGAHPMIRKSYYLLQETFRPLLQPIQRVLPDFGGIDFSPIIFFFGLMFVEQWVFRLFSLVGA